MPTDYEAIARSYQRAKRQPWRNAVESYTLLSLLGDPAGKAIVDLACGEGHYTRLVRQAGANPVLGVDLSPRMIDLAREEEDARPLNIHYQVGDARELHLHDRYHLALAAYLLNYAPDRDTLGRMARSIANALRPGGRFVSINASPWVDPTLSASYLPYGFEIQAPIPLAEGTAYTWILHLDDGPLAIENYHLPARAHEEAFLNAGFREFRWRRPQVDPQALTAHGAAFWQPFLEHPPIIGIEAIL